jgi:signal transduction histidine kinase
VSHRGPGESAFSDEDWRVMVLRLAHEIRNPLATIKSSVQLTQRLQTLTPDTADMLDSVLDQVQRIDRTVRDMQRFVRIAAGQPTPVAVELAVADAVAAHRAGATEGEVRVTVADGPRLHCLIDPQSLSQAVGELVGNAIEVSSPGAGITVSWTSVPQGVRIDIADEGPGVDEKLADRITRPFFSTFTQGTGLGLNIAAKIAQLAGGSLQWTNRKPRGACFSLLLPGG